jgi:transposase InsO family protein
MKTVWEKTRFFIKPKDKPISDKWTLIRNVGRKTLTDKAQLKLEWIIFYYTRGKLNAKLTAETFGICRKTFHKWLSRFDEKNLKTLEEQSKAPNNVRKRDISPWQESRIIKLRLAHIRWGKMKLQRRYIKIYGEYISSWKIQKVIEERNLYYDKQRIVKRRQKRLKGQPRNRITKLPVSKDINYLWHVDTVILTMTAGGYRYLLTGIDEVSKLAYARLYKTHHSKYAKDFLLRLEYLTDKTIVNIHHDNGSEFAKDFTQACQLLNLPQWYSRVKTPKDNAVLERFNRTIQEDFCDVWDVDCENIDHFNQKLTDWLVEYNDIRPHQTLAQRTPLEYIDNHKPIGVLPMSPSYTPF